MAYTKILQGCKCQIATRWHYVAADKSHLMENMMTFHNTPRQSLKAVSALV